MDFNGKNNPDFKNKPTGNFMDLRNQYWEKVGDMPAQGFANYGFSAPTLGDSLPEGIFWSKFLVVAHTNNSDIYWASLPDSGYSVDNLAPAVPMGLSGSTAGTFFNLQWSESAAGDLQYYAIYRGEDNNFGNEPFATATEASLYEITLSADEFQYAVAAIDFTGNQSELSNVLISPVLNTYAVAAGWSGISSWITPENPDLAYMLTPLSPELIIFYNNTGMYWPGQNLNTLGNWNQEAGYVIKMAAQAELPIIGSKTQNPTFETTSGWQLLPVLSPCPLSVSELQNQLGSNLIMIKEVAGWRVFWPELGIETLQELEPGKAYYLNTLIGAHNFQFPQCASKSGFNNGHVSDDSYTQQMKELNGSLQKTPATHTIAITQAAMQQLQIGDVLSVLNSFGENAGSAEITSKNENLVLTAFGDDPTTWSHENMNENETLTFSVYRSRSDETFEATASFDASLLNHSGQFVNNGISSILDFKLGAASTQNLQLSQIKVFPNPGDGIFHVSGLLSGTAFEILDSHGQILQKKSINSEGIINLKSVSPGVYYLKVVADEQLKMLKLVVK